jgi:hypothetical protein
MQLVDLLKNIFFVFAAYYLEKFFKENRCHILPITKEDFSDWKHLYRLEEQENSP